VMDVYGGRYLRGPAVAILPEVLPGYVQVLRSASPDPDNPFVPVMDAFPVIIVNIP